MRAESAVPASQSDRRRLRRRLLRRSSVRARQKRKLPMSDDDRDFIERAESLTEKLYGEPMSVDAMADNFALYGLKKCRHQGCRREYFTEG
jgi:hypothetical protein